MESPAGVEPSPGGRALASEPDGGTTAPPAPPGYGDGEERAAQDSTLAQLVRQEREAVDSCRVGLQVLIDHEYRHPENPSEPPDEERRAWSEVYAAFTEDNLLACEAVGAFLRRHEGLGALAEVRQRIASHDGVKTWEDFFTASPDGLTFQGDRIGPYCPGLHLSPFDCVKARERISEISVPRALDVLDLLDRLGEG